MIIDTTYLLTLSRIEVDTDLLKAIAEGKTKIGFEDLTINNISIFELQAKAAKLGIPPDHVTEAVEAINKTLRVEPFDKPEIIETSFKLRKDIQDYIDCIILATAITLKEDLITEDTLIIKNKQKIKDIYGIDVLSYKEIIKTN
jgi:predicted nucleic acid-binding protein